MRTAVLVIKPEVQRRRVFHRNIGKPQSPLPRYIGYQGKPQSGPGKDEDCRKIITKKNVFQGTLADKGRNDCGNHRMRLAGFTGQDTQIF